MPPSFRPRRAILPGMTALALCLGFPIPSAEAHAILEASQPAANAVVPAGTVAVTLRFNSRIDRVRSRLTLTRPDRSKASATIEPEGPPERLTATLSLTTPGAYVLRWQVLAIDGHITRGDLPFAVTGP